MSRAPDVQLLPFCVLAGLENMLKWSWPPSSSGPPVPRSSSGFIGRTKNTRQTGAGLVYAVSSLFCLLSLRSPEADPHPERLLCQELCCLL